MIHARTRQFAYMAVIALVCVYHGRFLTEYLFRVI